MMIKNNKLRLWITGAKGFVGQHLVQTLRDNIAGIELYTNRVELTDPEAVKRVVADFQPDSIIHLAGISSICAAQLDSELAWQVNLHGTINLGRAILEYQPNCRLIFSSTAEAWGSSFKKGVPVDENIPLAPTNIYAASKAAADLALGAMASEGLRVIRFRPFNHTGPGQNINFVVPAFVAQIVRIERGLQPPIIHVGNLSAKRDFLDVRDVVSAYRKAVIFEKQINSNIILPLCSGKTRSIASILDELITLSGISVNVELDRERLRSVDIPLASGSAQLTESILNWKPIIPWSTTLKDIIDYWRSFKY